MKGRIACSGTYVMRWDCRSAQFRTRDAGRLPPSTPQIIGRGGRFSGVDEWSVLGLHIGRRESALVDLGYLVVGIDDRWGPAVMKRIWTM